MKTSTASPQQHRTASACKPYILEVGVAVLELVHPKANACKSLPSGQARVPHKNEAVSWCLAARDGVRWNGVTLIPDLGMVSQVCVCVCVCVCGAEFEVLVWRGHILYVFLDP